MRVPGYRLHRPSGRAVVTLNGKDHYLGPHGTPASREKYRALVAEYVANRGAAAEPGAAGLLVAEAVGRFEPELARMGYRERHHYRQAFRDLVALYGTAALAGVGPKALKAVRAAFVRRGWCRRHCNHQAARVVRFLRWCVAEEFYPAAQLAAVRALPGLRAGEAPDRPPVAPVEDAAVEATLPFLPPYARGLVELLRWTGCRPGEAVLMRPEEVDLAGRARLPGGRAAEFPGVWAYHPPAHKTAHRGRARVILLGPRAQAGVGPLLRFTRPGEFVFAARQGPGAATAHYRVRSLHQAIERACGRAGVAAWFPYQLRHGAAVRIKQQFGEEWAKDVLGHADLDTTAIYLERDLLRAAEAMRQAG